MNHPKLPSEQYDILYADPPWDYKGQLQHAGPNSGDTGGAVRHYETVTTAEMAQWKIWKMAADNSLLFMWATSPHLDQAIDLGKAWRFQWATVAFVWDKMKTNPGFYTLSQCELCLVFKRGKIPQPRGARNIRQLVPEMRGKHSAKPNEVRKRIEQMFPTQSKLELFARRQFPGWDAWGNQALPAAIHDETDTTRRNRIFAKPRNAPAENLFVSSVNHEIPNSSANRPA